MYNVMLVDDEPLISEGLKDFLHWEDYGFSVLGCAYNGNAVLEKLASEICHLVITDVRMPVMDGISLTKRIKADYPHIQVIILSGYRDFEYAQKAMEYGACGYLLKPVQKNELIELLNKAHDTLNCVTHIKEWGEKASYFQIESDQLDPIFDWDDNRIVKAALSMNIALIEREVSAFITLLYSTAINGGDVIPLYQKRFAILKFISIFDPILSSRGESLLESIPTYMFWNLLNRIDDPVQTKQALTSLILLFGETIGNRNQMSCVRLLPGILEYVKDNLDKEISLKSIATVFYVSPVYLGKIFKREMKISFNDYLHCQRIEKVKALISISDISVSEIMQRTGYKNHEYFYKMFKKYENTSFAEYRRNKKKDIY